MAARCLLLVWVKSAKGIPQPRANVFQERGRCWGILPSGGAVLGIVPGHGGHRHRQDLRQPVLDGGDDLEEMKSGLSSQKGITMLRQHRTIPALRLKHRSGSCGPASALPKCSIIHIQYYLRFWLSICRTSLAVSALRIMRYCPETDELFDVSDRSQLPAFNLSCVNCNPSHAILCGTYLII